MVRIVNKHNTEMGYYGDYVITRYSYAQDTWEKFFEITMFGSTIFDVSKKDFAIEQGASYKYAIQKINRNWIATTRLETNAIVNNYEDMFLLDENR